jgi:MGT family glycosyltransferase
MSSFLFFNVPSTGHVDPTLPVVAELIARGHKVDYFLTEAYRERVESTIAAYHAYKGIGPDYFDEVSRRFNPAQLATQLVETAISLHGTLREAIERIRPDVVVYDSMCPWGRIAARHAGLPAVASMALLELPPRYLLKSGELRYALRVFARGLPWLPRYGRAARALRQRTGIRVPSFVRVINWPGDHNICYTVPALLPNASRYGADYTFVGPPRNATDKAMPFPFDELATDRPLIYVSLGTVFNDNPAFFRACLDAFAGREVQVVLSTGRGRDAHALGARAANAIVRDYVPQQAILQRASLFISHSGANSVHQALYYGVPLLMVPQQVEQGLIAARIVELGAGLLLHRRRVTPERVSHLADELLGDASYRARSAALGAALHKAGGAQPAAEALERIANRVSPGNGRSR